MKITRLAATFGKNPFICIEYADDNESMQYRKFAVSFSHFSNKDALYQTLITDYPQFFNKDTIELNKLQNFVNIIIDKCPELDLRTATKAQIDKFKEQMNREYEMNVIKPGDPGFEYDMRVEFDNDGETNMDWD